MLQWPLVQSKEIWHFWVWKVPVSTCQCHNSYLCWSCGVMSIQNLLIYLQEKYVLWQDFIRYVNTRRWTNWQEPSHKEAWQNKDGKIWSITAEILAQSQKFICGEKEYGPQRFLLGYLVFPIISIPLLIFFLEKLDL